MEKQKRWQFYLILAVIVLTLINILPTVFYYLKPLRAPITEERANVIATQIIERVNSLEEESKAWLLSFSKNLGIKPASIHLKEDDPGTFVVTFNTSQDASLFKRFLSRAGYTIPFLPAQLELGSDQEETPTTVWVSRKISTRLDPADASNYFHFYSKEDNGELSQSFKQVVYDRAEEIALSLGGPRKSALQMEAIVENLQDPRFNDLALSLSREIADIGTAFGEKSPLVNRYLATLLMTATPNKEQLLQKFITKLSQMQADVEKESKPLKEEKQKLRDEGKSLDPSKEVRLAYLGQQEKTLAFASLFLKEHKAAILAGKNPLTLAELQQEIKKKDSLDPKNPVQTIELSGRNPFVESLTIDWSNDVVVFNLYEDIQLLRKSQGLTEEQSAIRDKANQLVINEIARVARETEESIAPFGTEFAMRLTDLTGAQSFLAFDLNFLAEKKNQQILEEIRSSWRPENSDLSETVYPVVDYNAFQALSPQEQKLALVVYAPAMFEKDPPEGLKKRSLYVIAKGLDAVQQKYKDAPDSKDKQALAQDIERLVSLLRDKGFIAYSGASYGIDKQFSQDVIFELEDYYSMLLNATRENFYVKGSKRQAILDFTDVEQRLVTLNKIEDSIHEDLLKQRDDYNTAQVSLEKTRLYEVPPPTKNVYWENLKLSLAKYFRGDDRKILRWGLDLSGGKTIRIGLRDQNNRVVTEPEDLNRAVNELYDRINKMGVAERSIRIENNNIILDFPGSQALSANDLVKASAMYFHIVNEKFSLLNPTLKDHVNEFLQGVWNEAVVTNRKDADSINEIAWEQLGGDAASELFQPRSESARILVEQGLRLANVKEQPKSSSFDDTLSAIAVIRGEDFSEWQGQSHPLMIVFHNYALEGSSLTNVQTAYDPSEGNVLNFSVKSAYESSQKGSGSPREDFYAWTSQFAEDKIAGTPKEAYSQGRGWRMAVILNNHIVTSPALRAALRDSASISGRFSQREITQLAADLKAGSLSFTPKILSEQNVSAELGKAERTRGILASLTALVLVAASMIGYYRFAGFVATCAVFFNLLIMWGVLQNLGAALTLPGIAGIVLAVGMAIDANVLVFERIREEFAISGRIASAIQAGYKKAFSAIVDSNITTIIAALILIQFDSGPVKGFAITLIIGLVSSMFTALFMTRYFFAGWVKNPKNKELKMANLIKDTHINFLGYAKIAMIASLVIILIGGFLFYDQRKTIFGMDFTGGYSLAVELEEQPLENSTYRQQAINAFLEKGAGVNDFEVRELNKPNSLRFQFSLSMEEKGHPFYEMPESLSAEDVEFAYEKDPRIVWVVDALREGGLRIQQSDLGNLENNWSMMSGQFSEKMRNNAALALGFALFSIFLYITFRFEFKYAASAVLGLAHDVVVTLGILAILHKLGMPFQIDLKVIGAIMTIIGYSLNDTIIIFDRIREDVGILRKLKFHEVVNHALNVTLTRTLMTSGTTILVLLPLVTFGGQSIFDFSLVMTIGVIVGTLSSLFIVPAIMLYFHNKEETSHHMALKNA